MADFDKPSGYPVKALSQAVKGSQKKKPAKEPAKDDGGGGDLDPRKFVEINPQMNTDKVVTEALQTTKVDYLIRLGLGSQDELSYYRQAMSNPKHAITQPYLRPYVADLLTKVLKIIFDDTQIYTRVTTVLKSDLPSKTKDKRLGEDEKDPLASPGGVGSDELTKRYADMTPGQSFELIKKALKGKKND